MSILLTFLRRGGEGPYSTIVQNTEYIINQIFKKNLAATVCWSSESLYNNLPKKIIIVTKHFFN